MKFKKMLLGALIGGLTFVGWAGQTRANSINVYLDSAPVTVGSTREFTYRVQITPGNEVRTGNFFTVYDFQGLIGAPTSADSQYLEFAAKRFHQGTGSRSSRPSSGCTGQGRAAKSTNPMWRRRSSTGAPRRFSMWSRSD